MRRALLWVVLLIPWQLVGCVEHYRRPPVPPPVPVCRWCTLHYGCACHIHYRTFPKPFHASEAGRWARTTSRP